MGKKTCKAIGVRHSDEADGVLLEWTVGGEYRCATILREDSLTGARVKLDDFVEKQNRMLLEE